MEISLCLQSHWPVRYNWVAMPCVRTLRITDLSSASFHVQHKLDNFSDSYECFEVLIV